MTDDGAAPAQESPGTWFPEGLAVAILFLFASMVGVSFILPFHKYRAIFEEIGMTELPWLTGFFMAFISVFRAWWWAIGAGCIFLAALSWKVRLGRTGWKPMAAILLIAVLLPAFAYVAMEMPLVELQRKLGGGH
jgi:type II secretory pathway component PulF